MLTQQAFSSPAKIIKNSLFNSFNSFLSVNLFLLLFTFCSIAQGNCHKCKGPLAPALGGGYCSKCAEYTDDPPSHSFENSIIESINSATNDGQPAFDFFDAERALKEIEEEKKHPLKYILERMTIKGLHDLRKANSIPSEIIEQLNFQPLLNPSRLMSILLLCNATGLPLTIKTGHLITAITAGYIWLLTLNPSLDLANVDEDELLAAIMFFILEQQDPNHDMRSTDLFKHIEATTARSVGFGTSRQSTPRVVNPEHESVISEESMPLPLSLMKGLGVDLHNKDFYTLEDESSNIKSAIVDKLQYDSMKDRYVFQLEVHSDDSESVEIIIATRVDSFDFSHASTYYLFSLQGQYVLNIPEAELVNTLDLIKIATKSKRERMRKLRRYRNIVGGGAIIFTFTSGLLTLSNAIQGHPSRVEIGLNAASLILMAFFWREFAKANN